MFIKSYAVIIFNIKCLILNNKYNKYAERLK